MTAATEFVVPKSIPNILLISFTPHHQGERIFSRVKLPTAEESFVSSPVSLYHLIPTSTFHPWLAGDFSRFMPADTPTL
jgi:hypothetical protein